MSIVNLDLTFDDELIEESRKIAAEEGMSLEAYIVDFLERSTAKDRSGQHAAAKKNVQDNSD